jgi:hypothetical protein
MGEWMLSALTWLTILGWQGWEMYLWLAPKVMMRGLVT